MQPETATRLIELNNQFYQTFAEEFSATRQRLQPGVAQILDAIPQTAMLLDLGCGNGQAAAYLAERGFSGSYLGLDASETLVEIANQLDLQSARFIQADLSGTGWDQGLDAHSFDYVLCFAVMHHLPGVTLRIEFLKRVGALLKPDGRFIHSNWQFLGSEKLRERIVSWEKVGLSEADVDENDYLLDWRRGGTGYRYVHQYGGNELNTLAETSGFKISGVFSSDGQGGKLSLYQIWEPAGAPNYDHA